jgi:hypothetical protein
VKHRRALGLVLTALLECLPGLVLLVLALVVVYTRRVEISPLPLLAVLLSFFSASLVARKSLPRALRKLYSWRLYDALSPLLLLPPLILLLQSGYNYYDVWHYGVVLRLVVSFTCGLALFFTVYPLLRRL